MQESICIKAVDPVVRRCVPLCFVGHCRQSLKKYHGSRCRLALLRVGLQLAHHSSYCGTTKSLCTQICVRRAANWMLEPTMSVCVDSHTHFSLPPFPFCDWPGEDPRVRFQFGRVWNLEDSRWLSTGFLRILQVDILAKVLSSQELPNKSDFGK